MSGDAIKHRMDQILAERAQILDTLEHSEHLLSEQESRDLYRKLGEVKRELKELKRKRAEVRQALLSKRQEALALSQDPTLDLLDSAFTLFRELRQEQIEFAPEENALIDAIGIHLRERLGLTARNHKTEGGEGV